jgi:hypothetical protein
MNRRNLFEETKSAALLQGIRINTHQVEDPAWVREMQPRTERHTQSANEHLLSGSYRSKRFRIFDLA